MKIYSWTFGLVIIVLWDINPDNKILLWINIIWKWLLSINIFWCEGDYNNWIIFIKYYILIFS